MKRRIEIRPSLEKLREGRPPPEEQNRANRPSLEKQPLERCPPLEESYREINPSLEKLPRGARHLMSRIFNPKQLREEESSWRGRKS